MARSNMEAHYGSHPRRISNIKTSLLLLLLYKEQSVPRQENLAVNGCPSITEYFDKDTLTKRNLSGTRKDR